MRLFFKEIVINEILNKSEFYLTATKILLRLQVYNAQYIDLYKELITYKEKKVSYYEKH